MSPASDMTDPFAIPSPEADAATRLERALERIAAAAHPAAAAPASDADTTEIAARLDALIARVRDALGEPQNLGEQPSE